MAISDIDLQPGATTVEELERIPKELFDQYNLELDDKLLNFFIFAGRKKVSEEVSSWSNSIASILSAIVLERSLKNHAAALTKSAHASEKLSQSLTMATWALFFATLMLVIITVVALFL